ncbi:ATP-binding protein [Streptomyces sp. NPDC088789]|uniref:ATP-binding protein n=1 Tax=Streptomyces sp. NPDC088789 TaxID=3365899 RepID=UPI00380E0CB6
MEHITRYRLASVPPWLGPSSHGGVSPAAPPQKNGTAVRAYATTRETREHLSGTLMKIIPSPGPLRGVPRLPCIAGASSPPGRRRPSLTQGGLLALPAESRYVPVARRFADQGAAAWGLDQDCRDTLVLIVGELAANAAQHGGAVMSVKVWIAGPELCVEVTDTGPLPKVPHTRDPADGECGRGLGIVDQLTDWCTADHTPLMRRVRAGFGIDGSARR